MASANNAALSQSQSGADMWGRILQRATICQHMSDLAGMVHGHH
jgi:hypothetical protein